AAPTPCTCQSCPGSAARAARWPALGPPASSEGDRRQPTGKVTIVLLQDHFASGRRRASWASRTHHAGAPGMHRSDLREARDYVVRARAVIEDAAHAPDGASV